MERTREGWAKALALVGGAAVVVTVVVIGALHFLPPTSEISPIRRTISEYGLTSLAWAFNLGVLSLAVGSGFVFTALWLRRRLSIAAGVFGGLWVIALIGIVSFPKFSRTLGGAQLSGSIHRSASVVAFLALPVAVLLVCLRRDLRRQIWAKIGAVLAVGGLAWFVPIVMAIVTSPFAWWQQIPLGLVERGLALTEVLALLSVAGLVGLVDTDQRRGIRVDAANNQASPAANTAMPTLTTATTP